MPKVSQVTNTVELIKKLPPYIKPIAKHFQNEELKAGASLANSRFIQDTMTNLAPKAIFSRSKADLFDMSFMEISESMLVYYCPTLVGENIFRKLYSKGLPKDLAKKISTPLIDLKQDGGLLKEELQKIKPVKAAIALSSMLIPITEFSLNYVKNLLTLKVFKQSDFDNIANLNKKKDKKEDKKSQDKVKKNAIKNIIIAGCTFGACLAASCLMLKKGDKSKVVQKMSDVILTPGDALFKNNDKMKNFTNKYFSLDFSDNQGKLGLSRGQLTSCVLIGGLGYFGASKQRGKQNFLETLFRYPLVGFYVITGSELFEKQFKKILKNKDGYKNLIDKNLDVKTFSELPELAKNISAQKGTTIDNEFKNLLTKKAIIKAVPFAFSIGFMGLFVAGISRLFTQYRYDKEHNQNSDEKMVATQTAKSMFKSMEYLMKNNQEDDIFKDMKKLGEINS